MLGFLTNWAINKADRVNLYAAAHICFALGAFGQQHIDNLLRGPIAKQLAQCFFMPADAIGFDQIEKIARCVTRQG